MLTKFKTSEVEKKIGYVFKNPDLLEQAFIRSSYSDEFNNEHLEFLGDSALGMIVAKHLDNRYRLKEGPEFEDEEDYELEDEEDYEPEDEEDCESEDEELAFLNKNFYMNALTLEEMSEYKISLVQRSSLAPAIEKAGLEKYLLLGKSDIMNGVQNEASVKEDLFEAILGAVAVDSDWNIEMLEGVVKNLMDIDSRLDGEDDESDGIKELTDSFGKGSVSISERKGSSWGTFPYICNLTIGKRISQRHGFDGFGKTPKGARIMAAKRAEKYFKKIGDITEAIISAVGKPDYERAINQIQELYQKKIISEPKYIFSEDEKGNDGNPMWRCKCLIRGVTDNDPECIDESKPKAKKFAAYHALNKLMGTDLSKCYYEEDPEEKARQATGREHGTVFLNDGTFIEF